MSTFNERVKELRTSMNLSLRQLADLSGVSSSSIHAYEIGSRQPTKNSLEALSDIFNCDIDYLLGKSDTKNKVANDLGYESLHQAYLSNVNLRLFSSQETVSIGEKIRSARISKGLTQEELGEILGVQKSAIAKYENGRIVNIKRSTLKKISDVLGIPPFELVYEKETAPTEQILSEGEEKLLQLFRLLPKEAQDSYTKRLEESLKTLGLI